ncbi:MAG: sensor histidine kinase [bacterium]
MKYCLAVIIFSLVNILWAQDNVKHYSTIDGLPHDVSYGVFQDSNDLIWIGTDDGLAQFDGEDFLVHNSNSGLSSNYIIDIKEFSRDELVIATWRGGLNFMNLRTKNVVSDTLGPKKLSNLCVYKDTIYNAHDGINQIFWIDSKSKSVAHKKLRYIKSGKKLITTSFKNEKAASLKYITIESELYAIADIESKIEIKGVFKKNRNGFKTTFKFLDSITVHSLINYNDYLIASSNNSLILFDDQKIIGTKSFSIGQSKITKIVSLNENEIIFLATDSNGLKEAYSFNLVSDRLQNLRVKYGIQSSISDILIDKEGNLWLSAFGDGIYCVEYQPNVIETIKLDNSIIDLDFLSDKTYCASVNTLYEVNNLKSIKSFPLQGLAKQVIAIKDVLWINSLRAKPTSTIHGASEKNIKEQYAYKLFSIKPYGAISVVNNQVNLIDLNLSFVYDRLEYNIFDAFNYNDTLYFATNKGLYFYDEFKSTIIKDEKINADIKYSNTNVALLNASNLFLGTDNGLWIINSKGVTNFSQKDGLINETINALNFDHRGNLWIGTQKGLSVYDGSSFINLNQHSGLLSSYVSAIKENDNNEVWIAGNKGLSIIDNNKKIRLQKAPKLLINQNGPKFNFNAISFNRSNLKVEYSVNNNNWVELPRNKGTIDFSSYKPANYQVVLRAKKSDSDWTYTESLKFAISQPIYKRWWFVAFSVFTFGSVVLMLILNRLELSKKRNQTLRSALNSQKKLQEELSSVRENIAKDFHDDLGNKLARITMFSDILREDTVNATSEKQNLLDQIHQDSNDLYKGTKDFIFSLKSDSNMLEELVTYLSDFAEDYLKSFGIILRIEKDIKPTVLPYYWSKQIINIFKEALTNAVKHSKCSEVRFVFKTSTDQLIISCEDNGTGFNKSDISYKNGLENMCQRAAKIHCSLTIASEPMKGARVIFSGKLH